VGATSRAEATAITYRILPVEEWGKVEHIFREHGGELPPPLASFIVVGESESGEIVFVCAPVTVIHVEHAYVAPEHRGHGVLREGLNFVDDALRSTGIVGYYAFTQDEKMSHMAREFGMCELPFKVHMKRFDAGG
jgi:GNAT superfamily N-acetyltransferase